MAMTLPISSHTDVCSVFQLPHVKCTPHKTSVLIDRGDADNIMTVQLSDKYAKSLKMVELTFPESNDTCQPSTSGTYVNAA